MAGEECALNWLEAAAAVGAPPSQEGKERSSSIKRPLVLSVVHSSLHSQATLSRIEVYYGVS